MLTWMKNMYTYFCSMLVMENSGKRVFMYVKSFATIALINRSDHDTIDDIQVWSYEIC